MLEYHAYCEPRFLYMKYLEHYCRMMLTQTPHVTLFYNKNYPKTKAGARVNN